MGILNWLLGIDSNYIVIILFALIFSLEQFLNTPFKQTKRPQHLLQNVLIQLLFLGINFFYATFLIFSIKWFNENQVGLFYLIDIPYWIKVIAGVAIFDLTTYWIHRMAHKVPFMWRLHRVHHSDTTMDSSTYFRGHPIEITMVFLNGSILTAAIFGLDLFTFGIYSLILIPLLISQHANIKTPEWVDKTFGKIFVTPNLHKIHHEQDQFHTDSIYADIFIVWDRLFGTYTFKPLNQINLGLKEFDSDKKQTFWYLMKSPFINIRRISSDELLSDKEKNN